MILTIVLLIILGIGVASILLSGLWGIFEKAGKPGWLALIPFYNVYILLDILRLPWWGVFFACIPVVNFIPYMELGRCFKKGKIWSFFLLSVLPFIGIPILGFNKQRFIPSRDITTIERQFSKFIKFAFYSIIIVFVNIIGIQIFLRFDLTNTHVYSLSPASQKAVSTLKEPLTIRAFFSSDLPADYLDLRQYAEDMFEEYSVHGGKNFNFRFYDVGGKGEIAPEQQTNRDLAGDYGIYPSRIQIYENDAITYREAYMGMAVIHGDLIEKINDISSKERLEYDITATIQKLNNKISALLALGDTIKVKLFLSSDFYSIVPSLKDFPDQVEQIVKDLNKENYNKLEFIQIDPSTEFARMEQESALNPKYFLASAGDGKSTVKLYADLVIQFGDKIEKYNYLEVYRTPWGVQPQVADVEQVKESIKNTVTSIINVNEYIGYLIDHGTVDINLTEEQLQMMAQMNQNINPAKIMAKNFKELLSERYTIKEVKLAEENQIPAGIECLVIAGPMQPFNEWELFQIDQFLMQGKSLAIFIDGIEEKEPDPGMQQMYGYQMPKQYLPLNTGLETLLEFYGASVKNSYIYDERCYRQVSQGGEIDIYFIPQIQNESVNRNIPFMKNLKGLLMVQPSPVEFKDDILKQNNIKADILFSSSKQSWEEAENINLDNITQINPVVIQNKKSYPLAVTLEGNFISYYKGKPLPQRPKKEVSEDGKDKAKDTSLMSESVTEELPFIEKAEKPGRIFLAGSSMIVRDLTLNYVPAGSLRNTSPNRILISNIIDYGNHKEDYAVMRSKLQLVNPLNESKPFMRNFTQYFNLIGLPLIVFACGIIVLIMRGARKKQLQMQFSRKGAAVMDIEEEMPAAQEAPARKMRFSKDYLTLVIIIGLLFGVFIWVNISQYLGVIQYKLPTLAAVDKNAITKMIIKTADKDITLEKNGDKWNLAPDGFPADQTQIDSMLSIIANPQLSELISKQKQYDRYELDENKSIHLEAYKGDTIVRDLNIGKTSPTSSHTYVTLKNDANIYSIKGNLKTIFEKDAAGLRDKKVCSFPSDDIVELTLEFDGQTIVLQKKDKKIEVKEGEESTGETNTEWVSGKLDKPVKETIMNTILSTMSNLIAEDFISESRKSEYEAKPFKYRLTAKGKKNYVVTIFPDMGDNVYPGISTENDYVFKLVGWRASNMMKTMKDLRE